MYKKQTLPFPSARDCWFWTRSNLVIALFLATTTKRNRCIFCNGSKSIESTLVDEGHLLESLCSISILTQTVKKFDVAFHNVKLFKMSLNGITLIFDRLEITMAQSGIKLLQEHRPM